MIKNRSDVIVAEAHWYVHLMKQGSGVPYQRSTTRAYFSWADETLRTFTTVNISFYNSLTWHLKGLFPRMY